MDSLVCVRTAPAVTSIGAWCVERGCTFTRKEMEKLKHTLHYPMTRYMEVFSSLENEQRLVLRGRLPHGIAPNRYVARL